MTIAAASQTSAIFSTLPLLALLLFVIAVFRWNRRSKTTTKRQLDQLERELKVIRNQVLLVTTNTVPGERTIRTIGYVEALSEAEAASDWEYRLAEKQALLDLARQAIAMGANAIVGLRKSNAHYDQAGSQWRVSRVTYQGTAVVVDWNIPKAASAAL